MNKQAIKTDLEVLIKSGHSFNILLEDMKDDPDSYDYTKDELGIFILENPDMEGLKQLIS